MPRLLHWRSVGSLALQLAVLAILSAAFFLRAPQVSGMSMSPHINSGEFVLINTFEYRRGGIPKRGDIVAFQHDGVVPEVFIKRVIGLAGDRVRIERGAVLINDAKIDEPYVQFSDTRSFPEVTVPAGSIYVLGDNRANSEDSRFFGPVSDDRLIGHALAGIWPPGAIGAL